MRKDLGVGRWGGAGVTLVGDGVGMGQGWRGGGGQTGSSCWCSSLDRVREDHFKWVLPVCSFLNKWK